MTCENCRTDAVVSLALRGGNGHDEWILCASCWRDGRESVPLPPSLAREPKATASELNAWLAEVSS